MMKKKSIYICDDHLLFLESIEIFFNLQENYFCIGHANTIEMAFAQIIELKPDVILIDYHIKDKNGLELLRMIRNAALESKCFMLTMRRDVLIRNKTKEMGGNGYLLKSIGAEEMMLAIEKTMKGSERFFDSLVQERVKSGEEDTRRLSNRELQIAQLVCKEFPSEAIATKLNLSLHTVSTHRKNILRKLKLKNTLDLLKTLNETYGIE
jgi:DNA-binding NarL/FixJ family response regulator